MYNTDGSLGYKTEFSYSWNTIRAYRAIWLTPRLEFNLRGANYYASHDQNPWFAGNVDNGNFAGLVTEGRRLISHNHSYNSGILTARFLYDASADRRYAEVTTKIIKDGNVLRQVILFAGAERDENPRYIIEYEYED